MPKVFKYKDDQYMFTCVTHTREIVRAILLDENNNVCLEKIKDDDGFGPRDYYDPIVIPQRPPAQSSCSGRKDPSK